MASVKVKIITDIRPFYEGRGLHRGEAVSMSSEDAEMFIKNKWAEKVGKEDGASTTKNSGGRRKTKDSS